jgi:hypothetical protein
MANPESDCFIQTTRIQINETVVHFQSTKEKAMDMFQIIQNRLHIPQFMTFGIKLTAILPFNAVPQAAEFIEQRMLPQITERAAILGEGRQGTGIRMILHQDGIYELKIEPFFGDLSQLYVELDIQHPVPFNDIKAIEPKIDAAYNYLFGPVKEFVGGF